MRNGFFCVSKFLSIARQFYGVVSTHLKFRDLGVMNSESVKEKLTNRPFRVSIEGNIGSGKTTLINYFEQFSSVQTYEEPLEKWRNVNGHNLLGLLYEDMTKWNATFQSYVQLTRMQIQSSKPKEGIKVQMFERSVQNNRHCFLENSYRSGLVSPVEYAVLCKWYEWIKENVDISLDLIVYLRSDPQRVYERVLSRKRSEEKTVTLKYLQSLHEMHEKWLCDPNLSTPVFVIDGNAPLTDVIKSYTNILPALYKLTDKSQIHSENRLQKELQEMEDVGRRIHYRGLTMQNWVKKAKDDDDDDREKK